MSCKVSLEKLEDTLKQLAEQQTSMANDIRLKDLDLSQTKESYLKVLGARLFSPLEEWVINNPVLLEEYLEGDKLEKTVDQMVKLKEGKLNEGKAFDRWRDHEISVQKLYRDTIWAQKNVPNKKKEVKMIQKLLKQLDTLVRVITGQTVDKK